jgi:hypothetical protein
MNDNPFICGMAEAKYNLSGNSKKKGNIMLDIKKLVLLARLSRP